jgi:hypothetical protein
MVVWVVADNLGKRAWSLTNTRLPGKVWLLARILVETMDLASVRILHMWRHHRLISQIRHRLLGMHCIQRTLGRITPCRSCGDRHSSLSRVPLIVERITPDQTFRRREWILALNSKVLLGFPIVQE